MRRAATAACALAVAVTLTAASASPATSATASITRSAHVAFEGCNAQHIKLTVTISRHAFTPAQRIPYTVRIRNSGGSTCGAPLGHGLPQAHQKLVVGPCGVLPVTVRDSDGTAVYPGPAVFFCPNEAGFRLGPHGAGQTTAYWNQIAYLGTPPQTQPQTQPQHAPPGTYRLTVDGAVTVPVTLTPG